MNGRRMCRCGCGLIPEGKRADAIWADHSSCPQRVADREALGLHATADPARFWEGTRTIRPPRPACRG